MKKLALMAAVASVAALLFTSGAHAEMRKGAITLSPVLGGYLFEGDQPFKANNGTLGMGLGYNITKNLAVEAMFNYIDTDSDTNGGDVAGYLYKLDGLYNIPVTDDFVPYGAAGLGAITTDPKNGGSDTDLLVNYGAGFRYFLTDMIALRTDVRHIISFDDTHNNLLYTVGVTYFFGGDRAEAEPAPPPPPPAPKPEPKPEPAPAPPAPKDTDGDGVYDDADRCPDTPRGAEVDKDGCPLDTDGDGVPDYMDKCPGTPENLKVDGQGCPVLTEEICIVLNIEFDFDKADIKPVYHDDIKKVADCLNLYPGSFAVLEGHTDSRGSEAYNLRLSEKRAEAVRQYLINEFGIEASRLGITGFGESKPVADNSTEEGRRQNRRVYARITSEELEKK